MRTTKPSLIVTLPKTTLYLRPSFVGRITTSDPDIPPDESDQSLMLEGSVCLTMVSSRAVDGVDVTLEGTAELFPLEGFVGITKSTLHKELFLPIHDTLQAGDHVFKFSFLIPVATSTSQRSKFGVIRHCVSASATLPPVSSLPGFNNPMVVNSGPYYLNLLPASHPNEPPPSFTYTTDNYSKDLGDATMQVIAPHLRVGGLISIGIQFHSPPETVTEAETRIFRIAPYIEQQFAIQYGPGDSEETIGHPEQVKIALKVVDIAEGKEIGTSPGEEGDPMDILLQAGEPWTYQQIFRLPKDYQIRPSTIKGSQSPIVITSHLVVEVFSKLKVECSEEMREITGGVTRKKWSLRKKVKIVTCHGALGHYESLPAYEARDSTTSISAEASTSSTPYLQSHSAPISSSKLKRFTTFKSKSPSRSPSRLSRQNELDSDAKFQESCCCTQTVNDLIKREWGSHAISDRMSQPVIDGQKGEVLNEDHVNVGEEERRNKSAAYVIQRSTEVDNTTLVGETVELDDTKDDSSD